MFPCLFQRALIEKLRFGKFRYDISWCDVCVLVISKLDFLAFRKYVLSDTYHFGCLVCYELGFLIFRRCGS